MFHQKKQVVKRYLRKKARYFAAKAASKDEPVVVSSDESVASEAAITSPTIVPPSEAKAAFASPMSPIQKRAVLSPGTVSKIAASKAAAEARRAAAEGNEGRTARLLSNVEACCIMSSVKNCSMCLKVLNEASDTLCSECIGYALKEPAEVVEVPVIEGRKEGKQGKRAKKRPTIYDV